MRSLKHKMDKLKWAGILLLMILPTFTYGQVSLSLPDTTLRSGETIDVPIYVSNLQSSDGVIAGEFEFSFNESYFDIVGINKSGTMLSSVGNVVYFEGTDRLAFASSDTVTASGDSVLVYLQVKAFSEVDYFRSSNLEFISAQLNEGSPAVTTENGSLRTLGVRIYPKSNIQITEGDTLQFELQEDATDPITWTVTDSNIAQIDANGQFVANTTGTVQVKAVDATGLRDSTAFFTILPNAFTDLSLSIPDTSITQTLTLDLPVRSSDLTGLAVTSLELDISFSDSYLSLKEVLTTPRTSIWGNPTVNIDNNRVQIAAAGTDSLSGTGDLYILRFEVTNERTGNSSVSFNSGLLNENLQADLENSTVTVNSAPDIPIAPQDTAVSIGNTLQFSVTGGNGTAPYSWETSDASIASIDGTGLLTGVSRGDVVINARDDQNFPSDQINVRVNDFDAYLDSLELTYPDTATIGLYTNELSSYSIFAFESEVSFDTSKFSFVGLDLSGTQSEAAGLSVQSRDSADFIRIAGAGTSALSGTQPVIKLMFAPKNSVLDGEQIPVNLKELSFNEPSPAVPTTTPIPGLITISRVNPPVAPSLVSPGNNTTDVDTALTLTWDAVSEANSYRVQISTDQNFGTTTIDTMVSANSFEADSLDFSTQYYWRVAGINDGGQGTWSSIQNFTTFSGLPGDVSLVNPANNATGLDTLVTFSWNSADLAGEYQLQVSSTSDFSTSQIDSVLSDTSLALSFDYGTQYFWRVKAINGQGSSLNWSTERSFTTIVRPPTAPIVLSPADGTANADTVLQLKWTSSTNADSFRVEVSTDSLFNTIDINESLTDTLLSINGLSYETAYFWRVLAKNEGGESSYSPVAKFTTRKRPVGAPDLLTPLNNATGLDTALTLTWENVENVEGYEYRVSSESSFGTVVVQDTSLDTSADISGLDYSSTYFWQVRTIGSTSSDTSSWSVSNNFTTKQPIPEKPILVSPANNATNVDTLVNLIWNNIVYADSFQVELSTVSDFTSIVMSSTLADTMYQVNELNYDSQYYWRVRAKNETGIGDWSAVSGFTTTTEMNQRPEVISSLGSLTLSEDFGKVTVAKLSNVFSDPEGGTLSYQITAFEGSLIQASIGTDTLYLSSVKDQFGTGSVVVKALDAEGLQVSDTLMVEVTPVNDLPKITGLPKSISFKNDETFSLSLDTSITDIEDTLPDLDVQLSVTPDDIVVALNPDEFSVSISAPGFEGEGTLTITVSDSEGGSVQASITIDVQTSVANEADELPVEFSLSQNYPNPFNPSTNISYAIPKAAEVKLLIFDMLGRNVASLVNERKAPGRYTVRFDAGNLSSGTYIYRIEAGSFVQTKKLMLIK